MNYGRDPISILSTRNNVTAYGIDLEVPDHLLNAMLYKLLLLNHRDELVQRLRDGKTEWLDMVVKATPEYAKTVAWLNSQEDDVVRKLTGEV